MQISHDKIDANGKAGLRAGQSKGGLQQLLLDYLCVSLNAPHSFTNASFKSAECMTDSNFDWIEMVCIV